MLAFFSSNIFPTMNSIGWSFEEPLSYDDYQKNTTTITMPQFQTDQTNKLFEGLRVDNTTDLPLSHHQQQQCLKESEFDVDELGVERSLMEKKLNHNASERNRRKKMNFLYSTLRSLLPPTNKHQKKKLSFPATVSYVQEYIPELKKEIERLSKTKDLLLSKKSNYSLLQIDDNKRKLIMGGTSSNSSTTSICASQLSNGQVLVQISTTQENDFPISQVFASLEEDGLILLNASSFKSFGDKVFHSLHFQTQGPIEMDIQILKMKLLVMCEKRKKESYIL
ncbi:transcription factor bHLH100-like [Solanum stenotomum]|uniref:transcription factor bHLH100-like n=1 Tax=Solanum stenotomum TaxID=172797 RepID=UPI0020D023C8|nr:transcription factor bHLH100-like [Solanum stenotomum]